MSTKYLYCRVSTVKQLKGGNSLEDQKETMLQKYPDGIVVEEQYTGTTMDRPKLNDILAKLQPGDYLVVTKLDRLARSAADGSIMIKGLMNRGITVDILNMGIVENTLMGRLILNVLLAFAEFERDLIVERTQTGRKIAHENGAKFGRPSKYTAKQEQMVTKLKDQGYSYTEIAEYTSIPRPSVINICRRHGMAIPRQNLVSQESGVVYGLIDDKDEAIDPRALAMALSTINDDSISIEDIRDLINELDDEEYDD